MVTKDKNRNIVAKLGVFILYYKLLIDKINFNISENIWLVLLAKALYVHIYLLTEYKMCLIAKQSNCLRKAA